MPKRTRSPTFEEVNERALPVNQPRWDIERRAFELVNWYENADVGPTITSWPNHYQNLLLKEHKKNSERFKLWNFLVSNGVDPQMSADIVLWHGTYDKHAVTDVNGWVYKHQKEPNWFFKYSTWDLYTNSIAKGR